MQAQKVPAIVSRHYQEGEQIDVVGLNRITVLVDRSQTALTEVGWNFWKADLDGPPHFHDAKEQLFFATDGEAVVTISGREHRLTPNSLLHVPIGAMHRTVVVGGQPHAYLLFNAFRDSDKEGKVSFADHLSEAKHIRRRQADEANQGAAIDWSRRSATGTLAQVDAALPPPGTAELVTLISREATLRSSAALLRLAAGQQMALETQGAELTVFALAGAGRITAGGQDFPLAAGTVQYLPAETADCGASAGGLGLVCLALRTHLD